MNEQKAISRLKQGDITGLEVLVQTYELQAIRAAFLIVNDRAQAEDIVQAAFLRVSEKIHQFDANRPFGPWFYRSVVHAALKTAERQKRFTSLDANDSEEDEFSFELASAEPLPEAFIEAQETRWAVWQALQTLTPAQRAVIVMRYYLNMREDEMADRMQDPPGTIKWRLHAARHRLKELLQSLRPEQLKDPTPQCFNPQEAGNERKRI